jgi:hypothetical protein
MKGRGAFQGMGKDWLTYPSFNHVGHGPHVCMDKCGNAARWARGSTLDAKPN